MTLLISCLLSVLVCAGVFAVLYWVRTPHYRLTATEVARLLEWVLLGQATANDWRVFCDIPISHDARLEAIRQQCQQIDELYYIGDGGSSYLLNKDGLQQVRRLLDELRGFDRG
ncbi:MAG: hypothetical protein GYB33_01090 [Gammaproteobacteria bacterium]|nr:hypothetical protein [Gammaproteobacteria bacterium]